MIDWFLRLWFHPKKMRHPCEGFRDGQQVRIPLGGYLTRFVKKGQIIPTGCSLATAYGTGYGLKERSCTYAWKHLYRDGLYGFVLHIETLPVALITWDLDPSDDRVIVVKQIQGVARKKGELAPLRWEKMLVQIVIDWAQSSGMREVHVITGRSHPWYISSRDAEMHLKYDVTARRMGFVFNEACGRYVRPCTQGAP